MNNKNNKKIKYGFIGAGNMAKAIIAGMLKQNELENNQLYHEKIDCSQIIATTKTLESAEKLSKEFGISANTNNDDCLLADVIVLCVKPQILNEVLERLNHKTLADKLIISVIAGVPNAFYEKKISSKISLIRVMPNTPSLIGRGMSGIFANANATEEQKILAEKMMLSVGKVIWLEKEEKINYVTATSGSGPAYFYEFTNQLANAGMKLGLTESESVMLARETIIGAGLMLDKANKLSDIERLRNNVTSKGGTTFEALSSFRNDKLDKIVDNAVQSCYRRAIELGDAMILQNINNEKEGVNDK